MSTTTAPTPIGIPNTTTGAPTTRTDQAIEAAKNLPDLISRASAVDPDLAAKFTGSALIASRSPWGTLAGGIVTWAVARWGLGWDQSTCDLVAGAGVLVASYLMRYVTEHPITGIFRKATVAEAMNAAGAK
jgi:hypothetical protein